MQDFHNRATETHTNTHKPADLRAKHFGPSPAPVRVRIGGLSHPGLVRANNEDHFMVVERRRSQTVLLTNLPAEYLEPASDVGYLMGVADGMGGAAFGELASMLVFRSGWEQGSNTIQWTWIVTEQEIENLKERAELVFRRMDEELLERAKLQPECEGMGTTLTGLYTVGLQAFIAHAGDSRAYLFRDGRLTQLTRDHTLAQECLDQGMPVPARSWYHILTNCLGGSDTEVRVEFHHFQLVDGDRLLLCTDGLTDMVPAEEMTTILAGHTDPQETAQALVDAALAHGGKDNVTAVLAHYQLAEPAHNEMPHPTLEVN